MPKETETMPTWLAQHWAAATTKTEEEIMNLCKEFLISNDKLVLTDFCQKNQLNRIDTKIVLESLEEKGFLLRKEGPNTWGLAHQMAEL